MRGKAREVSKDCNADITGKILTNLFVSLIKPHNFFLSVLRLSFCSFSIFFAPKFSFVDQIYIVIEQATSADLAAKDAMGSVIFQNFPHHLMLSDRALFHFFSV